VTKLSDDRLFSATAFAVPIVAKEDPAAQGQGESDSWPSSSKASDNSQLNGGGDEQAGKQPKR
jgi:hypothetical protein